MIDEQTDAETKGATIKESSSENSGDDIDIVLGRTGKINTKPIKENKEKVKQDDTVFTCPTQPTTRKTEKEFIPSHPGASSLTASVKSPNPVLTADANNLQNSEIIEIESDREDNRIRIKRVWTVKLGTADEKHFNNKTRSILGLKDAFDWTNRMILKIDSRTNTFRTLLSNDVLFDMPSLYSNPKLLKYRDYIQRNGVPNQNIVVIYQAFARNLLKTIAKPDTFILLSRNLGRLPFTEEDRKQFGALVDALIAESDPNYDGNCISVSGRRIEEIVRQHFNRILTDNSGATKVEVNFRASKLDFNYQLKTVLKHGQFAWCNVTGMVLNKVDDFDAHIKEELKEAQLLLSSLLNTDLVNPGPMSALFASNMADSWSMDENGVIRNAESWNHSRLTRLAKPAPVDDVIRILRNEIRLVIIFS